MGWQAEYLPEGTHPFLYSIHRNRLNPDLNLTSLSTSPGNRKLQWSPPLKTEHSVLPSACPSCSFSLKICIKSLITILPDSI